MGDYTLILNNLEMVRISHAHVGLHRSKVYLATLQAPDILVFGAYTIEYQWGYLDSTVRPLISGEKGTSGIIQ